LTDETLFVFVLLNHRVGPIERGERFEDPLNDRLEAEGLGEVTGGGTGQKENGEIEFVGIDVELTGDWDEGLRRIVEVLEAGGAPKGSELQIGGEDEDEEPRVVRFGKVEGIAVYLDGVGLPDEVYATTDADHVLSEIDRLCEGVGSVEAHWQGPTETALYVFGSSAAEMERRIQPLLASYPLCQNARVARIA
jgi:hypothetical protein